MDPHLALERLLIDLFTPEELRRFPRYTDGGVELVAALPSPGVVPPVQFVHGAVEALRQRGLLTQAFFQHLMAERPGRAQDIGLVMVAITKGSQRPEPGARATGNEKAPPENPFERLAGRFLQGLATDGVDQIADHFVKKTVKAVTEPQPRDPDALDAFADAVVDVMRAVLTDADHRRLGKLLSAHDYVVPTKKAARVEAVLEHFEFDEGLLDAVFDGPGIVKVAREVGAAQTRRKADAVAAVVRWVAQASTLE